ncbi:unnamed protein product [Mytilus edulis]|uniref:DZIP3-like HEPN domain-containing protein n=1 Tax=Mytilus edulis TaxID=6550 RepID=A0A8S3RZV4_MYTED|nr:unnamed protein product [Mytilus edulis]
MVNKINVMVNIFGSEENVELFDDTELVMEDNKRILIPVFMQLDIPTSWDKTKVFEAIDEFRLTGTPDMNIRIKAISIDDLNMYAEIAKQVLGNVHELRSEINKLMSTMLSDAEIDTMENAELCVNLNVPDTSENEPNKEIQDQTSVKTNLPVSVTLRQQLNIKNSKNENPMTNSCIKTGNTLVFTDYINKRLIICNSDGTDIHHIPLSYKPHYITEIDSNTVAVSCIYDRTILIINISTRSVTSTINTSGHCWGISYNDNNLYVVIGKSIIHVMDLTGKVIRTIPVPSDDIRDITVDRDRTGETKENCFLIGLKNGHIQSDLE